MAPPLFLLKPSGTPRHLLFLPKPYPNPPADSAISTCPSPNRKQQQKKTPPNSDRFSPLPIHHYQSLSFSLSLCNSVLLAPHCLLLTHSSQSNLVKTCLQITSLCRPNLTVGCHRTSQRLSCSGPSNALQDLPSTISVVSIQCASPL